MMPAEDVKRQANPGGRPSKLTPAQWDEVLARLVNGETVSALAREYGVDKANISRRFSKRAQHLQDLAKRLVSAQWALEALTAQPPILELMGMETTEFFRGLADRTWDMHRAGMKAKGPRGFSTF